MELFKLPEHLIGHVAFEPKPKQTRTRQVSLEGVVDSRVDPTQYRGNGHWKWDDEPLGSKPNIGFIYVIKDCVNNKLYLGKKQYFGTGKINKGKDSNWRWYISSSKQLSESVKLNGKEAFEFHAIEQYKSKGGLSYAETWSLTYVQAPVNQHIWYNGLINEVSWVVKEPPTERHIARLNALLDSVNAPHPIWRN